MLGILIAAFVVWKLQAAGSTLQENTFRTIVLISIIPAVFGGHFSGSDDQGKEA